MQTPNYGYGHYHIQTKANAETNGMLDTVEVTRKEWVKLRLQFWRFKRYGSSNLLIERSIFEDFI